MKLNDYIKEYIPKINDKIGEIFNKKISVADNEFLKDYYKELQDYFLSGGKRIRPLMTIATFNAFHGGDKDCIVLPSTGIEFLHNASLVHDDIIDKDDFRRGAPAFHYRFKNYHSKYNLRKMGAREFGTNIGIIGGDTAFFMGLEAYYNNTFPMALNYRAIALYQNAFINVSDGVLIEIDMVNKRNLTMDDYIHMISLKTGALIEKSILIGANYAKTSQNLQKLMGSFGINLGIIFQIKDDILGTFGDEKKTGKPTDGDIREGKKTSLLISALNNFKEESKKARLLELIESAEMTEEMVEEVRGLFIESNAVESSKGLMEQHVERADDILKTLKPNINEENLEFFEDLLEFVIKRNF